MKKIFALVLALVMVASLATVAFAAESEEKYIELTVDALGLASQKYADGNATVSDIDFSYIELGNYGSGIQMRNKSKASAIWNTEAIPGNITKIVLTVYEGKTTYDNADCFSFTFGAAADALNSEVKFSTKSGTTEYTVEAPEGAFSFFKMLHTGSYSYYWASIKVYYKEAAVEEEEGNNVHPGYGDIDVNTVPCPDHSGYNPEDEEPVVENEYTIPFAPTCTEWGCILHVCDVCGYTYSTDYTPATHTAGEWVVEKEATATETGLKVQYCAVCNEKLAEENIDVIVPETTAPQAPETTAPQAPETTAPQAPETTAPVAPETTAPVAPETTAPVAPETTAPAAPETTAPAVPETTTPVAPGEDVDPTGDNTMLFVIFAMMSMAAPAALVLKKKYF